MRLQSLCVLSGSLQTFAVIKITAKKNKRYAKTAKFAFYTVLDYLNPIAAKILFVLYHSERTCTDYSVAKNLQTKASQK
jgi:hypothetical protein